MGLIVAASEVCLYPLLCPTFALLSKKKKLLVYYEAGAESLDNTFILTNTWLGLLSKHGGKGFE